MFLEIKVKYDKYFIFQVVRRKKSMAQQEKEVTFDKDNVHTSAGSTPLQYKLPITYF